MNKGDLRHFEALLRTKRAELLRQLDHIEQTSMKSTPQDSSGDLSSVAFHMADQASDSAERELAFLFASREGRYLHHLDEALERIARGEFGVCRICGKPISKDRLEAVPHATMCIGCKSREERARANQADTATPEEAEEEGSA